MSDADRAKQFYTSLGWREDADFPISEGYRVLQFTPPGSQASIIFGAGVTPADAVHGGGARWWFPDEVARIAALVELVSRRFHRA